MSHYPLIVKTLFFRLACFLVTDHFYCDYPQFIYNYFDYHLSVLMSYNFYHYNFKRIISAYCSYQYRMPLPKLITLLLLPLHFLAFVIVYDVLHYYYSNNTSSTTHRSFPALSTPTLEWICFLKFFCANFDYYLTFYTLVHITTTPIIIIIIIVRNVSTHTELQLTQCVSNLHYMPQITPVT